MKRFSVRVRGRALGGVAARDEWTVTVAIAPLNVHSSTDAVECGDPDLD
jgi:hypothetical protein